MTTAGKPNQVSPQPLLDARKRFIPTCIALIVTLWAIAAGCRNPAPVPARLAVHPDPGDLAAVARLKESPWFDLLVNNDNAFVYHGSDRPDPAQPDAGVSFVSFEFTGPVQLELRTASPILDWRIRPMPGVARQIEDEKLTLSLGRPCKFLFEAKLLKGGWRAVVVSAEPPADKVPADGDPGVVYLKAGVHTTGPGWNPFAAGRKRLWLAPGAVVLGTIEVNDARDIAIGGPGLLVADDDAPGRPAILLRNCDNARVEDIGILGGPGGQLEWVDCRNGGARNLKLYGSAAPAAGIGIGGQSIRIENCFIAAGHDRIRLAGLAGPDSSGPTTDITISQCILWGRGSSGGELTLARDGQGALNRVLAEKLHCLRDTGGALLTAHYHGGIRIENLTVNQCMVYYPGLFDIAPLPQANPGHGAFNTLTLKQIEFAEPAAQIGRRLLGLPSTPIANITCQTLTTNGKPIVNATQTALETNEFVTGLVFLE